ncbi:HAD family hydrolase [bacterium D16-51]|nr:HAD family hydrolase [bacterium D16-59]RKI62418.1 HAD family hydrolase [bacterium D16-51]
MDLVKNIILDVDGTLWNTTEVVAAAWNRAIQADGRTEITVDGARLRTLFGKPMDVIGRELFIDIPDGTREELLESCCQYEQEALKEEEEILLYPNVSETIKRLVQEQDRKLFIVSNCQCGYIELFLEKNNLASYITDFECFGNTGLPKGKNISLLADRNNILTSECIYVGDTAGDYEAAKEAGVPFLFAAYGFGTVEGTEQIQDFIELLEK